MIAHNYRFLKQLTMLKVFKYMFLDVTIALGSTRLKASYIYTYFIYILRTQYLPSRSTWPQFTMSLAGDSHRSTDLYKLLRTCIENEANVDDVDATLVSYGRPIRVAVANGFMSWPSLWSRPALMLTVQLGDRKPRCA